MNNKIKIQLLKGHLDVINEELSIFNSPTSDRNSKVIKSILQPIAFELLKKTLKTTSENEKIKISLAIYEAHYLEGFLRTLTSNGNDYRNSTIAKIIFEINEKLA